MYTTGIQLRWPKYESNPNVFTVCMWLSSCHGSVTENWRLKPDVSWATVGLFTFLYFHLVTYKLLYSDCEARCFEHFEWENHSAWVLSWLGGFSGWPLTEFWRHMLSGCQVCDWGIQYHLCNTYKGLWGLVVVWLSWLSGRALVASARSRCLGFNSRWLPAFSLSS